MTPFLNWRALFVSWVGLGWLVFWVGLAYLFAFDHIVIDEYGVFFLVWRVIHRRHEEVFERKAWGYTRRRFGPFLIYRKAL